MNIHNLQEGDRAFSLSLRREVKVIRVVEPRHLYEVETTDGGDHISTESECYELVTLDNTTEGRRNQKIVEKIEALYRQIAELSDGLQPNEVQRVKKRRPRLQS